MMICPFVGVAICAIALKVSMPAPLVTSVGVPCALAPDADSSSASAAPTTSRQEADDLSIFPTFLMTTRKCTKSSNHDFIRGHSSEAKSSCDGYNIRLHSQSVVAPVSKRATVSTDERPNCPPAGRMSVRTLGKRLLCKYCTVVTVEHMYFCEPLVVEWTGCGRRVGCRIGCIVGQLPNRSPRRSRVWTFP